MLLKLRERMGREEGFTLVELLVVMLILGLLAAIAIPSFFNQRDKARDADAKASVRTAQTAIETYATDNGEDGYLNAIAGVVGPPPTGLREIEQTLNDADLSIVGVPTEDTYTVRVTSTTGTAFDIARDADGVVTQTCNDPGNAGCPSDSNWGD